ncbi:MAG TPA: thiamine phosphate synthase [Roseiarcus sp.]|jgi:thiamine-phosphate pyrophosphorylase
MRLTPQTSPPCSLYLVTPLLSAADADAFARIFARALTAAPIACALVRIAPDSLAHAQAIAAPFLRAAMDAGCAVLVEDDVPLAARLGADGVHVAGAGADLEAAIKWAKPDRIVGAGALRTRDEAMTAAEMGADYVMFGEPFEGTRTMSMASLTERVAWWAEIFETPCVACADTVPAAGALADAGADFVALGEAIWSALSPEDALREAQGLIASLGVAAP